MTDKTTYTVELPNSVQFQGIHYYRTLGVKRALLLSLAFGFGLWGTKFFFDVIQMVIRGI